jgi:hypothetical protein
MAEEYCKEHYDVEDKDTRDVFISLLQIYLEPPEGIRVNVSACDVASAALPCAPFHISWLARIFVAENPLAFANYSPGGT